MSNKDASHADSKLDAAYKESCIEKEFKSDRHVNCIWTVRIFFIHHAYPTYHILFIAHYASVWVCVKAEWKNCEQDGP